MALREGLWGGLALFMAAVGPGNGAPTSANSLKVVIKDVRGDAGTVHIGLWNDAEGFAESAKRLDGAEAPARDGNSEFLFEDLTPGRYALIVYHDENGNGAFDRTLIGLPAEGLGFSNGAWIDLFGAPSFEDAAIELKDSETATEISVRY